MEQLALETAFANSAAKHKVFEENESVKRSTHHNASPRQSQRQPKEESDGAMLTSNVAARRASYVPGMLVQS